MANRIESKLTPALFDELLNERFVQVASIDHETGGPMISALSWVHAKDESTILFAVDKRSRIIANISRHPLVALNIIANETCYSISGNAQTTGSSSDKVPIELAIVQLAIKEVRDIMFYGAKIVEEPKFDKTYDQEAAMKLDAQVMNELKKH
ncbi:pyridoxamine 5'-phosphate oxidase family protein [Jeotgalibacillus sp. ET6]|uniref:pyridoxamine 5'-phosphate oxidase family protein n=1 Tax=Jeotgalibacillus sp. ET6 TaxID=3037260 RepID=UPI002418182B|nr:pyridoxamine 5'-phosphate oxidase family protein [Jeotgalibacillus sp. ET6]MDG5470155.1 pyridoxamine 5'-phosphate oxidase family protein [Jeotgalibacillus sp. ET6]